ncbi:citramalate synthase [Salinibacter sp. 10B]|uniref:citramalate synthase n=1 Tax=Salinibacter sp. 10B TaxID=1923971 RepID=UPI000CF50164|nr:citramalate synthase [Salinibacter sp. 10B]PQJ35691.1 citramalate synthase [Salinibacter sp. 10B]
MTDAVELFDTTLRDGTQGEHVTLSAHDKVRIAQKLDAFGIDVIEGGWPGSNPKDQAFFEEAKGIEWEHAAICAFGSTRHASNAPADDPNLQALIEAQTDVVSIFGKSWTLHVEQALGISLKENLDLIRSSVAFLREHGKRVIYDAEHFFDGYADHPEYALKTLRAAAEAGADTLVLCDTNGGSLPHDIHEVTATVHGEVETRLGIHAHNDGGCGVANSLAAVRGGARHVQGTINGLGERCGNADLCSVIPDLQLKMGYDCVEEEQLTTLADLSGFTNEIANLDPNDGAPYVGRSAFTHKGGIHVSAVMKEPSTYEHVEPEAVGNRRRALVSDLSGKSNIRYKADEMGLDLDSDDAAQAVERIKELEHLGYEFQGAEASFELLLRTIQGDVPDFFDLERMRVWSGQDDEGDQTVEASLALTVQAQRTLAVAEGNGPVDALSNAMGEGLESFYPHLDDVHLTDYKVRVLTPQDGTGATVRVLIEHSNGAQTWNTVGVSANILDASWQALADGVRYFLLHAAPEGDVESSAETDVAAA